MMPTHTEHATIARLNDLLRRTFTSGEVLITPGIYRLSPDTRARIVAAVRSFDGFSDANDPYGEHDCATLNVAGERVMFKIDYYDTDMAGLSPDPSDPNVTRRVLTILLTEEY